MVNSTLLKKYGVFSVIVVVSSQVFQPIECHDGAVRIHELHHYMEEHSTKVSTQNITNFENISYDRMINTSGSERKRKSFFEHTDIFLENSCIFFVQSDDSFFDLLLPFRQPIYLVVFRRGGYLVETWRKSVPLDFIDELALRSKQIKGTLFIRSHDSHNHPIFILNDWKHSDQYIGGNWTHWDQYTGDGVDHLEDCILKSIAVTRNLSEDGSHLRIHDSHYRRDLRHYSSYILEYWNQNIWDGDDEWKGYKALVCECPPEDYAVAFNHGIPFLLVYI